MSQHDQFPAEEAERLPIAEPIRFGIELNNGTEKSQVRYHEEGELTVVTGIHGRQVIEPQPMGSLTVSSKSGNVELSIVGRISYEQEGETHGETTTTELAIVDMRRYAGFLSKNRGVKIGFYNYEARPEFDSPQRPPAAFALLDLKAVRRGVQTGYNAPRHFEPISSDPMHRTGLKLFQQDNVNKFSTTYGPYVMSSEIAVSADKNNRIIVDGGEQTNGKFSLVTAGSAQTDYQPQYFDVSASSREAEAESTKATVGFLTGVGGTAMGGVFSDQASGNRPIPNPRLSNPQIFNAPIPNVPIGGSGFSIVESPPSSPLDAPPRPGYESKIDQELAPYQSQRLSARDIRQIRGKLSGKYHPDDGNGSEGASSYFNEKLAELEKQAK